MKRQPALLTNYVRRPDGCGTCPAHRRDACATAKRLRPAYRRRGFTLVELVVVVAIVGVLAAIAYPVSQRIAASGRATTCVAHLRQLGAGLSLYLGENGMRMPVLKAGREKITDEEPVIDNTLDRYVKDRRVFACPADDKWAAATGTSYHWNVALNGQPAADLNFLRVVANRTHIPVMADKEGFHPYLDNKVNILYADGHATKEVSFFTEK